MNALAWMLFAGVVTGTAPESFGHLWPINSKSPREIAAEDSREYIPEAGDLLFYASNKPIFRVMYGVARSRPPYHVAILFRDPDGKLRSLEAGPDGFNRVILLDPAFRIRRHLTLSKEGVLWVRKTRQPLSPTESARLSEFAALQDGKDFALVRLGCHAGWINERIPIVRRLIPDAHIHQENWFCSELVTEAMRYAGIIPNHARAGNAIFPHHLWENDPIDLRCRYETAMRWTWGPLPIAPIDSALDARSIPVAEGQPQPNQRKAPK